MDLFLDHARQILEAAEGAARRGEECSAMTILVGREGGIHMHTNSDWPLESLARHHGAKAGYRVTERRGEVQVEGQSHGRTCILKSTNPRAIHRLLLGPR